MDINERMDIGYELNGGDGAWLVYEPYVALCFGFLDKFMEQIFVLMKDFDINFMETAIKDTLYVGMRQCIELMMGKNMDVLAGACVRFAGLWEWFKPSTMPRTSSLSRTATRLEKQRQRVRKAKFQMQLKALLFGNLLSAAVELWRPTVSEVFRQFGSTGTH